MRAHGSATGGVIAGNVRDGHAHIQVGASPTCAARVTCQGRSAPSKLTECVRSGGCLGYRLAAVTILV
ncbi:Uncharacterised protein [Mycobacteroides abscessus subsp. abscessus]|nr:Uncharacterised protein [Mycobacteroides abscessus subsp. abscessus]